MRYACASHCLRRNDEPESGSLLTTRGRNFGMGGKNEYHIMYKRERESENHSIPPACCWGFWGFLETGKRVMQSRTNGAGLEHCGRRKKNCQHASVIVVNVYMETQSRVFFLSHAQHGIHA
jgi:hypothetical protein